MAVADHVFEERRDDSLWLHGQARERNLEVEQVPRLLALVERAELGAEQFVKLVSLDLARALEPPRGDLERSLSKAVEREVFAGCWSRP